MSEPLVFLAQFADGRTCIGADRDGEARLTVLLSRQDAAELLKRQDEFTAGFYCTLVPEASVKATTPKRKRKGSDDPE